MYIINLDIIQSIGISLIFLFFGIFLKRKIKILNNFSIPIPVISGFIFSIIVLIFKQLKILEINFDTTLQHFFMIMFFTTIGFNASLSLLKKGGIKIILFLIISTGLILTQNFTSIIISKILNISPLIGLMAGSTALTGGHGTAIAISETINVESIQTIAITSATYGLIMGSLIGAKLAKNLIKKYNLAKENKNIQKNNTLKEISENILTNKENFANSLFILIIIMFLGNLINIFLKKINIGLPSYIVPMIIAAILRNIYDYKNKKIYENEIKIIEYFSLNIFLSMALMNLRLYELVKLAIPLFILLIIQTIITYIYVRIVTFKVMGNNYDAAIISAGHIGFGLGATPNAISNMNSVCEEYHYSKIAFFIVPIVGALFIDFINISLINIFINLIR